MSDDLTTEEVDATKEVAPDGSSEETEDLGALKRALEREREERREAKEELRRLREDDDYRREFVQQFYDFADSDDEAEDDDGDEAPGGEDPRVEALLQWKAQVDVERGQERFNEDLTKVAGDRDVSSQGRDWISYQTAQNGNNRQALEKATKAWFEYEDAMEQKAIERLKQSKKTRRVSPSGTATTQVPELKTHKDRVRYMMERAEVHDSQA